MGNLGDFDLLTRGTENEKIGFFNSCSKMWSLHSSQTNLGKGLRYQATGKITDGHYNYMSSLVMSKLP